MNPTPRVAIVGATGAVGLKMIECLEKSALKVSDLSLFASPKSVGKVSHFRGKTIRVQAYADGCLKGHDLALFSAGSALSKQVASKAAEQGTVIVDNSSAFRMVESVPLVVPEVNPQDAFKHRGIIANPNCSTIQLVVALKPLHDVAKVRRVVVATYQAVSGAGGKALTEFDEENRAALMGDRGPDRKIFPRKIAHNLIPQIPQSDAYAADGYTTEEHKMIDETKKIMGDAAIRVTATCVRVPVRNAHSEAVWIETERKLTVADAFAAWRGAPGLVLHERQDDFPTPLEVSGAPETHVGRVREDPTVERGLAFWVVADNLLKGAAYNAVQIAELLVSR